MEINQPLAPATFYILFALAGGEKHGYAIMREAREASDNGFDLGPATLYTTIQRLLDLGWIEEAKSPEGSDSRRRYYGLTKSGNATTICGAASASTHSRSPRTRSSGVSRMTA